jgi:4-amino-4-deoxy-L-arabinose transferase-like glycosyltransferase
LGLVLFVVALLVRVVYLAQSSHNPTFYAPIIDSGTYHELAQALARGKNVGDRLFWQPLFYPEFLSFAYGHLGAGIRGVKILQALLGAGTCVLVYLSTSMAFSRRVGLIAGFLVAFCGPLFFIEGELLGEGWGVFWAASLLALFVALERSPSLLLYAALGVSGALATITRPPLFAFFITACMVHGVRSVRDAPWRTSLLRWGLVGIGLAAILFPTARLNAQTTGRWGIFPSSGGINLYIGNNPRWEETVVMRPGIQWLGITSLPENEGIFDPWGRSAYFSRRVGAYVRKSPNLFLKGLALKTLRFFNARELPRNIDVYAFRQWSSLLGLLTWKVSGFGFPFGVLFPLAAVGLWSNRRKVPAPVWLLLTIYPAVIILYFVSSRYRLLIVPALAMAAAAGIVFLLDLARAGRVKRLAHYAGAATALSVLLCFPASFPEERVNFESEMYRSLGYNRLQKQDYSGSSVLYEKALRSDPRNTDALVDMSIAMAELNRNDEALTYITRAIALHPELPGLRFNLGMICLRLGNARGAEQSFVETLRLDPSFRGANANLDVARALLEQQLRKIGQERVK